MDVCPTIYLLDPFLFIILTLIVTYYNLSIHDLCGSYKTFHQNIEMESNTYESSLSQEQEPTPVNKPTNFLVTVSVNRC